MAHKKRPSWLLRQPDDSDDDDNASRLTFVASQQTLSSNEEGGTTLPSTQTRFQPKTTALLYSASSDSEADFQANQASVLKYRRTNKPISTHSTRRRHNLGYHSSSSSTSGNRTPPPHRRSTAVQESVLVRYTQEDSHKTQPSCRRHNASTLSRRRTSSTVSRYTQPDRSSDTDTSMHDSQLPIPHSDSSDSDDESQELTTEAREPLRAGDIIYYDHPLFVAGTDQAKRLAQVLSFTKGELRLDNADILEPDHSIRRVRVWRNGALRKYDGTFRTLRQFRPKASDFKGGTNQHTDQLRRIMAAVRDEIYKCDPRAVNRDSFENDESTTQGKTQPSKTSINVDDGDDDSSEEEYVTQRKTQPSKTSINVDDDDDDSSEEEYVTQRKTQPNKSIRPSVPNDSSSSSDDDRLLSELRRATPRQEKSNSPPSARVTDEKTRKVHRYGVMEGLEDTDDEPGETHPSKRRSSSNRTGLSLSKKNSHSSVNQHGLNRPKVASTVDVTVSPLSRRFSRRGSNAVNTIESSGNDSDEDSLPASAFPNSKMVPRSGRPPKSSQRSIAKTSTTASTSTARSKPDNMAERIAQRLAAHASSAVPKPLSDREHFQRLVDSASSVVVESRGFATPVVPTSPSKLNEDADFYANLHQQLLQNRLTAKSSPAKENGAVNRSPVSSIASSQESSVGLRKFRQKYARPKRRLELEPRGSGR